jgi:hypothetical protein
METYGADFLTPSFVIRISKHHHQYVGDVTQIEQANITDSFKAALEMKCNRTDFSLAARLRCKGRNMIVADRYRTCVRSVCTNNIILHTRSLINYPTYNRFLMMEV